MKTVYDRPHALTSLSKRFLSGDNHSCAKGKHRAALKNDQMVQRYELLGLVSRLLGRIPSRARAYNLHNVYIDWHFSIAVAKYAMRHDFNVVVCYYQHAEDTFAYLKDYVPSIQRILNVSANNRQCQAHIFLNDLATGPRPSHAWYKLMLGPLDKPQNACTHAIGLANWFLAASTLAAGSSPSANGIWFAIYRRFFGSNSRTGKLECVEPHAPMRFVYCCPMISIKRLHRLVQAFSRINPDAFGQALIGLYAGLEQECQPRSCRYVFTGSLLPERVFETNLQPDVLVFASMYEGLPLACLEALGCGLLPVVSTTCATAGANGLVLEFSSDGTRPEEIMHWCIERPSGLAKMRLGSRALMRHHVGDVWRACSRRVPLHREGFR